MSNSYFNRRINRRRKWAGGIYPTPEMRDRAKCQDWLTASGNNPPDEVRYSLKISTAAELAEEMLADWPDDYMDDESAARIFTELRTDQTWLD